MTNFLFHCNTGATIHPVPYLPSGSEINGSHIYIYDYFNVKFMHKFNVRLPIKYSVGFKNVFHLRKYLIS